MSPSPARARTWTVTASGTTTTARPAPTRTRVLTVSPFGTGTFVRSSVPTPEPSSYRGWTAATEAGRHSMRTHWVLMSFGSTAAPASSTAVITASSSVPNPVRPRNVLTTMPAPNTASAAARPNCRLVPSAWVSQLRPVDTPPAISANRKTRPPIECGPRSTRARSGARNGASAAALRGRTVPSSSTVSAGPHR